MPLYNVKNTLYMHALKVWTNTQYSLYLSLSLYIYIYGHIDKYFILNLHDMYGHELEHIVPYN